MPDAALFARAQAAAERLMVDTCAITRDPEFAADSAFDDETGELEPAVPATVDVYVGKCLVASTGRQDTEDDEGGAAVVRRSYHALIPVAAPVAVIGDTFTLTSSARDPLLEGQPFILRGVLLGTHAFQRTLLLELSVRADAQ